MTDYEMRKQTIEAYVNSPLYLKHTEKERRAMLLVLGSDKGFTDQTKKNSNSDYYEQHKESILATKNKKVECLKCGLMVSKANVKNHYKTKICVSTQEINRLNREIERLKKIITDNNLKI